MKHHYECRRYRRRYPGTTAAEFDGAESFDADSDSDAIATAKSFHQPFYDPALDFINVIEIKGGENDRLVAVIDGDYAGAP
jgi:hypothetical protein